MDNRRFAMQKKVGVISRRAFIKILLLITEQEAGVVLRFAVLKACLGISWQEAGVVPRRASFGPSLGASEQVAFIHDGQPHHCTKSRIRVGNALRGKKAKKEVLIKVL